MALIMSRRQAMVGFGLVALLGCDEKKNDDPKGKTQKKEDDEEHDIPMRPRSQFEAWAGSPPTDSFGGVSCYPAFG
jgi:hypothetical protein